MKTLILTFLLAISTFVGTTPPVQAQWVNFPKTVRLYDNATGKTIGTVTITGNTAYVRNKDGEHIYTVAKNPDGTTTSFDPNGNVIAPVKLPEND